MTNGEAVRRMNNRDLKDWYCEGRECGSCRFGEQVVCGFLAWLHAPAEGKEAGGKPPWYDEPLDALRLGVNAYRALYNAGIRTVGQLSELRAYDLQSLYAIGANCAREIALAMENYCGEPMKP